MMPTRPSSLVVLAVGLAAVAWGLLRTAEATGVVLPLLPLATPVPIFCLAAAVLISAIALRRRLRGALGTKPPHPIGVARLAVLGKASSHVGAMLVGGYGGYLLLLIPSLEIAARRGRAVVALLAALSALVLTVAGLILERACRVPRLPEQEGLSPDEPA